MYGISDKNISDLGNINISNVNSDVTGNWRKCSIYDDIEIEEYALSYYKEKFSNEKEIHWIINHSNNTTTSITSSNLGIIFVDVREHTDGEENNAKSLGGGATISKFWVYKDNGDIEKIDDE